MSYSDDDGDYGNYDNGYSDSETTHQSFCAKIGSSLMGVLVGLLLIVASIVCLFWNEGNAIHVAKSLSEAKHVCIEAPCAPIMPENDGKLVHIACPVTHLDSFRDIALGMEYSGLKFVRTVEMYQWEEEKSCTQKDDKFGGGTTTHCTYSYHKTWSTTSVDSLHFHNQQYVNPEASEWPMQSSVQAGDRIGVGAFTLESDLVRGLELNLVGLIPPVHPSYRPSGHYPPRTLDSYNTQLCGASYYTGDCSRPLVGDVRVSYQGASSSAISILGRQYRQTFVSWKGTQSKSTVGPYLVEGIKSEDVMFNDLQNNLTMLTLLLRAGGFVLLWISFSMVAGPLSVVPDIIPCIGPCIGDIIGGAICCASLLAAVSVSLITISIGWLAYRPLIGVPLLLLGILFVGAFLYYRSKNIKPTQKYAEVPRFDSTTPPYPPPLYSGAHEPSLGGMYGSTDTQGQGHAQSGAYGIRNPYAGQMPAREGGGYPQSQTIMGYGSNQNPSPNPNPNPNPSPYPYPYSNPNSGSSSQAFASGQKGSNYPNTGVGRAPGDLYYTGGGGAQVGNYDRFPTHMLPPGDAQGQQNTPYPPPPSGQAPYPPPR